MAENFCGRDCGLCPDKETLKCPGCRLGPGQAYNSVCAIAKCCRDKELETCADCSSSGYCSQLRGSRNMSSNRLYAKRREEQVRLEKEEKINTLAKWLGVLFWLVISKNLLTLFLGDAMTAQFPALALAADVAEFAMTAAYSLILIKLAHCSASYHYAGICGLIGGAVGLLSFLGLGEGFALLISLVQLPLLCASEFNECLANAEVVAEYDEELSERWQKLYRWYIGAMLATFLGALFALLGSILGALLSLGGMITALVVAVLKLVYLYKTSHCFQDIYFE